MMVTGDLSFNSELIPKSQCPVPLQLLYTVAIFPTRDLVNVHEINHKWQIMHGLDKERLSGMWSFIFIVLLCA